MSHRQRSQGNRMCRKCQKLRLLRLLRWNYSPRWSLPRSLLQVLGTQNAEIEWNFRVLLARNLALKSLVDLVRPMGNTNYTITSSMTTRRRPTSVLTSHQEISTGNKTKMRCRNQLWPQWVLRMSLQTLVKQNWRAGKILRFLISLKMFVNQELQHDGSILQKNLVKKRPGSLLEDLRTRSTIIWDRKRDFAQFSQS